MRSKVEVAGHFSPPRRHVSRCAGQLVLPRSTQGHGRDRGMPNVGARRSCRAVRGLRRDPRQRRSCRDRHCPKCQGLARLQWLADRRAELLPVAYFHVVLTAPSPIAAIALQNKALVYDILFKAAAQTIRVIAADPKHLGAETGMIAILHTWAQTLTHHPHVHCIVPGGGLGPDGRWVECKPNFFLPVHLLSRCYRRLFLERLRTAFDAVVCVSRRTRATARPLRVRAISQTPGEYPLGRLRKASFRRALTDPRISWSLHASRRHRQRPSSRLPRWPRQLSVEGLPRPENKSKAMTLDANEFMRRFLTHVLPKGFRRIRHFGFLANSCCVQKLARIRAAPGRSQSRAERRIQRLPRALRAAHRPAP